MEQVESLLIKYHPGEKDGAALIRLVRFVRLVSKEFQFTILQKSGALVHDSTLTVAGMTIASVKERFTIYCVSESLH